MALVVEQPGLRTTVQDLGRPGARAWGVPPGGAFDRSALVVANALLGNSTCLAGLELTLLGGTFRAEVPLALALAGAPLAAVVERPDGSRRPIPVPGSFAVEPGDRLVIGGASRGARAYLAAAGGFLTPEILGSRSREESLRPGEVLPAEAGRCRSRRPAPGLLDGLDAVPDAGRVVLRAIDGPDAGPGPAAWDGLELRVGPLCDRMGLRLEGPDWPGLAPSEADRASAPVAPGAVQVAGGRAIVLGVAGGTMGGYPHVAHVASADLDRLGQLRPGDEVVLQRIPLAEARRLDRDRRRRLHALALRLAVGARDGMNEHA